MSVGVNSIEAPSAQAEPQPIPEPQSLSQVIAVNSGVSYIRYADRVLLVL